MTENDNIKESPTNIDTIKNEKYNRLWYIESNGDICNIKKVSEAEHEVIFFNSSTSTVKFKNNKETKVFKTFKDAALTSIPNMISKKKEKWENLVNEAYKINEEISGLLEKLYALKGIKDD